MVTTESAKIVTGGQVAAADDALLPLMAAWLLTLRSKHSRMAYATDIGYRYADHGDGTYLLVRTPGEYAWLDFLDRAGATVMAATDLHVNLWLDDLRRRKLAESTSARKLVAVSSLYTYLVRKRLLGENPVDFVARPEVDRDESSTLGPDRDQALAMLRYAAAVGTKAHALVAVLLFAGLRVSELVQADVEDLGQDRGHRTLRITRKGGKVRRVVLVPPAWEALSTHLAGRTLGPLFLNRAGTRLSRYRASDIVADVARRAGVSDRFSAHSLRHGFATLALESGVALTDLQDAMGHADPRTTRRYDRARNRLDHYPGYSLADLLGCGPADGGR